MTRRTHVGLGNAPDLSSQSGGPECEPARLFFLPSCDVARGNMSFVYEGLLSVLDVAIPHIQTCSIIIYTHLHQIGGI